MFMHLTFHAPMQIVEDGATQGLELTSQGAGTYWWVATRGLAYTGERVTGQAHAGWNVWAAVTNPSAAHYI